MTDVPELGRVTERRPPFKYSALTRVWFSDTDAQGVVYYGRYLPYFDLSTIWVNVDVFEHQVPWLRANQMARVELPYQPGRQYRARVRYTAPSLNEQTRTMTVSLELENPDQALRADGLKVAVFRQVRTGSDWAEAAVDPQTAVSLEDKILTRARELRVATVAAEG